MRKFRAVASGAVAATMLAATVGAGAGATAEPTGVGTARSGTSLLRVVLGDGSLLDLRVLGEDSMATIDRAKSEPSAFTRVAPLDVVSKTVAALNASVPGLEAKAPGGSSTVPATAVPLTSPVSSGTLNLANLTAAVDQTGAKSALSSSLDQLDLVGGLLSLKGANSSQSTDALTAVSNGLRGITVDELTVLDLGALLDGLGLSLTDLPVSVVSDLLTKLGVPVPGLSGGTDLNGAVDALNKAIDDVQALLDTAGATVDQTVNDTVGGIIGGIGGILGGGGSLPSVPSVGSTISELNTTIDGLQTQLSDLLESALGALDAAPLLKVTGLDLGVATKAADTVANSTAGIVAKLGAIQVGSATVVPGLDLGATATKLADTVNQVTGAVGGVLGTVDPGLANVVSVKLFEQSKDVKVVNGYTNALAGLTALTASITPPADLGAIVSKIQGAAGIGDVLGGLGANLAALPDLSTGMTQLEGLLGGVQGLASGATLKVGEFSSTSEFLPAVAPAANPAPARPGGELPRTGGDNAEWAVLGVLFLAAAAAIARWLRRPVITLQ